MLSSLALSRATTLELLLMSGILPAWSKVLMLYTKEGIEKLSECLEIRSFEQDSDSRRKMHWKKSTVLAMLIRSFFVQVHDTKNY